MNARENHKLFLDASYKITAKRVREFFLFMRVSYKILTTPLKGNHNDFRYHSLNNSCTGPYRCIANLGVFPRMGATPRGRAWPRTNNRSYTCIAWIYLS